jgi:type II secretory pathway component PulJ
MRPSTARCPVPTARCKAAGPSVSSPTTRRPALRTPSRRRGVTLVEMLVTVAVLIIIMTIMVQVFQAATGAVTAVQTIQGLDDKLRLLDSTIRADLGGATTSFTPPVDPSTNKGYFEYGENEFADLQGEDSDDYIRFTAKALPGHPFQGHMYLAPPFGLAFGAMSVAQQTSYLSTQPISITSEYAEIIYFVRNGNLYRRVLLVAPQLQANVYQMFNNLDANGNHLAPEALGNAPGALTSPVGWQGMNDLSARPTATGNSAYNIILNSLGDLTNRENRAFAPRFANDFYSVITGGAGQDGFPDDLNSDNVPDYYPSLYYGQFNGTATNQLIFEPNFPNVPRYGSLNAAHGSATMAFPYVYPGAYSVPQQVSASQLGLIHSPSPAANVPASATQGQPVPFDPGLANGNPLIYLQNMNHNPLDMGDNLPTPAAPPDAAQQLYQTWWGFPTWREILSPLWNDPTLPVFSNIAQPLGLTPRTLLDGGITHANGYLQAANDNNLLPPMNAAWRVNPQLYTDGWGGVNWFPNPLLWSTASWEDDLIMTNVRSFDVKAYDNAYGGYADLGWGDDLRLYLPYVNTAGGFVPPAPPYLNPATYGGPLTPLVWPPINPAVSIYNPFQTFAHEGRMPPMVEDGVYDAQFGAVAAGTYAAPYNNYIGNVGDDDPNIVRMRRVWDSWSTEYSNAPGTGVWPTVAGAANSGFPVGPPFSPPIYPSYPPPYPAALRGIQIQIRVADPTNQRIKSLTIRQDFTDKL